jgi:hypothetical protein
MCHKGSNTESPVQESGCNIYQISKIWAAPTGPLVWHVTATCERLARRIEGPRQASCCRMLARICIMLQSVLILMCTCMVKFRSGDYITLKCMYCSASECGYICGNLMGKSVHLYAWPSAAQGRIMGIGCRPRYAEMSYKVATSCHVYRYSFKLPNSIAILSRTRPGDSDQHMLYFNGSTSIAGFHS